MTGMDGSSIDQAYGQLQAECQFGGLLGGEFGRAMEMGAGIGLGEDLINSIF